MDLPPVPGIMDHSVSGRIKGTDMKMVLKLERSGIEAQNWAFAVGSTNPSDIDILQKYDGLLSCIL